jgi:peptide/nickel transport system permease protein
VPIRPSTRGVTRFILKRLLLLPLLLVVFSVTVFAIVQTPPGNFLTTYVALASSGSSITAEQVAALRTEYGLDQPI